MNDAHPPRPDEPPEGGARRDLPSGRDDLLVREEPLLLIVHGQQLLTMRTPGRDADLALGFLLGEGILKSAADVQSMQAVRGDADAQRADELRITLRQSPDPFVRSRLARTHEIRSSCGVCGMADAQTILEGTPPLLPGVPKLRASLIHELLAALRSRQELFDATGGCHGALVADVGGAVHGFGEDVGRHNALDKAIGAAARGGADLASSIAILSGRAGYDLIIKCLRVRIPVIVSVSAPSALAFDLCQSAGATLIGFARGDQHQVYCGAERLV